MILCMSISISEQKPPEIAFIITGEEKTMQNNAYDVLHKKTDGLTVSSLDNKAVAVESLWQDHRVVLVFLRHFG